MNKDIKVVYGEITKESVMIDPNVAVVFPNSESKDQAVQGNVILTGTSARELLKKKHGR